MLTNMSFCGYNVLRCITLCSLSLVSESEFVLVGLPISLSLSSIRFINLRRACASELTRLLSSSAKENRETIKYN